MVPIIKEVPSLLHWSFLTQDFTSGPHSQLYTKNPLNIASDQRSTKNSPVSFPSGSDGKSICLQRGRPGFDPWVRKILWRRKWQPTPVLLPGKFWGWRNFIGYNLWGHKESDTTERLHFHFPNFSEFFDISTTWYSLWPHFLPCLSLSSNKSYIFPPKLPALSADPQTLYSYQQYNSFDTRMSDRKRAALLWPSHQVLEWVKPQNKKIFLSPWPIPPPDSRPHPRTLSLLFGSPLATQAPSQSSLFFLQLHLMYY